MKKSGIVSNLRKLAFQLKDDGPYVILHRVDNVKTLRDAVAQHEWDNVNEFVEEMNQIPWTGLRVTPSGTPEWTLSDLIHLNMYFSEMLDGDDITITELPPDVKEGIVSPIWSYVGGELFLSEAMGYLTPNRETAYISQAAYIEATT